MKLEKELVDTLRILDEYFKKHDIKYVLIGAQVPKILLSLDMNPDSRPTKDIDLALEFDSWDDYSKVITDLIELGFNKKSNEPEHRLFYRGTMVDLLPYIPDDIVDGYITFPESQNIMNLQGFDKLIKGAVMEYVDRDFLISVIPLHLSVYSKIIAFLDRGEQQNIYDDIIDILYVFENYEDVYDSERRFDIDGKHNIRYEYSGAFLVGQDLASCLNSDEIQLINTFLLKFNDKYSYTIQKVNSLFKYDSIEILNMFTAFRRGLEA